MQHPGYGLFFLFCGLILSTTAYAVNNHAHHPQTEVKADTAYHHHQKNGDMKLNQGKKWPTDKALRQGMKNIRSATVIALQSAHASPGHGLSKQQAEKLARQIHQQVSNMFAQCKLPAEADAVLHNLLADILQSAQQLKASSNAVDKHSMQQTRVQAMQRLQKSLDLYPRYFDDSEWHTD